MRKLSLATLMAMGLALATSAQAQAADRQAPFQALEEGRFAEALRGAQGALATDPDNPVWWSLAAEAQAGLGAHLEAAHAFARAAALEPDDARRSYLKRAQAFQLVSASRHDEARAVVRESMADKALATRASLDWAMVAIAARDDVSAQDILSNEFLYRDFTRQTALDAGYSAKRRGLDARAVTFFETGLELDGVEAQPLDAVTRENIRREIRELTRDWSFLGQVAYSTAGQSAGFLNTPLSDDRALQIGAEVSRRIGGWRNGRPFNAFARIYHSEFLNDDAVVGNATQGWLGVRYKPVSTLNLNLEASRLIGLDSDGIDDWSLRAAISGGEGLEPEAGQREYLYATYYGDISYLTGNDVTFGLAEGRLGYAGLLDDANTTLTPYAVMRLDYDSGRIDETALGVGVGVSLRHWFAEGDTVAQRGFVDFDVQARERIAGDRRASSVLATITVGR